MSRNDLLELRVKLLVEEITKSDKKSIGKMIQKAIAADSVKQKKEFQKMIKDELKSKAVKKLVNDIVTTELGSKVNKDRTADITKLVLRKLYRELAYNYTPVIDRIKI